MDRQILMNEEHSNFQRIFWRETRNEQLKEYSLPRVTYVTSAGSYLAMLNHLQQSTLIKVVNNQNR